MSERKAAEILRVSWQQLCQNGWNCEAQKHYAKKYYMQMDAALDEICKNAARLETEIETCRKAMRQSRGDK